MSLQSLLSNNRKNKERENEGKKEEERKVKGVGEKEGTKFQRNYNCDGSSKSEFMFRGHIAELTPVYGNKMCPHLHTGHTWRKSSPPHLLSQPPEACFSSVGLEWRCYRL